MRVFIDASVWIAAVFSRTLDRKHFLVEKVKRFAKPTLVVTPKEALEILRKS